MGKSSVEMRRSFLWDFVVKNETLKEQSCRASLALHLSPYKHPLNPIRCSGNQGWVWGSDFAQKRQFPAWHCLPGWNQSCGIFFIHQPLGLCEGSGSKYPLGVGELDTPLGRGWRRKFPFLVISLGYSMVTPGFFDSAHHDSPRWNFSLIQTPLESFDFMVLTSQPKTNTFSLLVWDLG